jgi:phospholipase D1/2
LQAIKRAENFIYIETQYLISGDHASAQWFAEGHNHIPSAIVNRILEKYEQTPAPNFHVYIVLPMFPEGAPDDPKLRPVRYFQWETIRWMKRRLEHEMPIIDQRLGRPGGNKHWDDYLSFYFLGNRSALPTANHAGANGRAAKVTEGKRYMIYVHSKLMIVDDEWILIGSANLNERSMSGRSDSEICVGMWATPGNEAVCRQEIRAFRERLWREHLGDTFIDNPPQYFALDRPHRPETYQAVQAAANQNRHRFILGVNQPIEHLMLWPLDNQAFAGMFIPDNGNTGDEWLVMPRWRGIGMLAPNEFLL